MAAWVGFGMLVAVADISVGSGMTRADWVQILGIMVAAFLIPIGGVVLLVGKRRHDRAVAAYAAHEGESGTPAAPNTP